MIHRQVHSRILRRGLCAFAFAVLTPTSVLAQANECNGLLNISYPGFGAAPVIPPPAEVDVQIDIGTGTITGGPANVLSITSFAVQLACDADSPLIPNCVADFGPGKKVEFVPGSVSDNCPGIDFVAAEGNGPLPPFVNNLVTFTASPMPLVVPAGEDTLPYFCSVLFKVRVLDPVSNDITPNEFEETTCFAASQCDNGVLVAAVCQTASIPVASSPAGAFDCYQVTQGGTPTATVDLKDTFTDTTGVKLRFEHRVCTPANKNDEDPDAVNSTEHLTGYDIKKGGGNADKDILVFDQFHLAGLPGHVGKAKRLLIPAAKVLGKNMNPGPTPPSPPRRHFQCYNFTADVDDFVAKLQDQFIVIENFDPLIIDPTKSANVQFARSLLFCVPVNKNDEDPDAESDPNALLCYQRKKNISDLVQDIQVSTQDQFQLDQNLKVTEFQELCEVATFQIL